MEQVEVDLLQHEASLKVKKNFSLKEANQLLAMAGNYRLHEEEVEIEEKERNFFETYRPLFLIVGLTQISSLTL